MPQDRINFVIHSLQNKIYNISLIHNLLYTTNQIESIHINDFARNIIHSNMSTQKVKNIFIKENYDDVGRIKHTAVLPLGIVMCEIIHSIISVCYHNNTDIYLHINIYKDNEDIVIHLSEKNHSIKEIIHQDRLSKELMYSFIGQLKGNVYFVDDNSVKIRFPQLEVIV